jgi:hypothetical protein
MVFYNSLTQSIFLKMKAFLKNKGLNINLKNTILNIWN